MSSMRIQPLEIKIERAAGVDDYANKPNGQREVWWSTVALSFRLGLRVASYC
jgi:hypothetical protein